MVETITILMVYIVHTQDKTLYITIRFFVAVVEWST